MKKASAGRGILWLLLLVIMTAGLVLFSLKKGSIDVTWRQLLRGLFISYDSSVAIIYDLRFPRVLVALLAGGGLSASGVLLQSALKNPLADPGIIGISGGAALAGVLVTALFPTLFFTVPLFACIGGILAYILIYTLAWKGSLDPIRIILVGVAVSAIFSGLTAIFAGVGNQSGVSLIVSGLSQLVWTDVQILMIYMVIGLSAALMLSKACNIMALEDHTIRGLGIRVDLLRFLISGVAVILCSGVTAVVGVIGFLALIAPHMAKKIVGNDHRLLLPFAILLGGFILLLADTMGRLVLAPTEISASIMMNIIGGPFFIWLLRREGKYRGR